MMPRHRVIDVPYVEHPPERGCHVRVNDVDCPDRWTHVLESRPGPGFAKVCDIHLALYATQKGLDAVVVWTRDAWEASGREAELRVLIDRRNN